MLRLLSSGSSGPDVADLQSRLNSAPPTTQAPLAVDGIFGPKTWAALLAIPELIYPPRSGIACGAGDPDNQPLVAQVAMEFGQDLVAVGLVPAGAAFNPFESGGMSLPSAPSLPSLPALPKFRKLSPGEEATARSVFGSSLDYGSVFITNKAGAKNRPFTVAIPLPAIVAASFGVGGIVQVLLLGAHAAAPSRDLLIHELTHVWQSQHASNKGAFIANSVACQAVAIAANLAEVATAAGNLDLAKANAIRTHKGFPESFPFSAYAHIRGKPFNAYAAEQIANQVEQNVAAIVAHVASVAAGAIDSDNNRSLNNNTNVEDVRLATVIP